MPETPDLAPQHDGFTEDCQHPDCVHQRYINKVQRLHDEHKAKCHLCRVADVCVVAKARQEVLDAYNR